jgi:hypothetical protein
MEHSVGLITLTTQSVPYVVWGDHLPYLGQSVLSATAWEAGVGAALHWTA